jgi:predicted PurR-regulated permease PerM
MFMEPHFATSPRWSPTTKLLVGLVIIGIVAFLFLRFTSLITPLLMVFILAYLLHPVATMISYWLRVSWKAAVNILYSIILLLLVGALTLGGVGLVGQVQSQSCWCRTLWLISPNMSRRFRAGVPRRLSICGRSISAR